METNKQAQLAFEQAIKDKKDFSIELLNGVFRDCKVRVNFDFQENRYIVQQDFFDTLHLFRYIRLGHVYLESYMAGNKMKGSFPIADIVGFKLESK